MKKVQVKLQEEKEKEKKMFAKMFAWLVWRCSDEFQMWMWWAALRYNIQYKDITKVIDFMLDILIWFL